METGSLACIGCGYEHNCSIRGCAIIREASDRLDILLTTASPWISVNERLPEKEEFVIAIVSGKPHDYITLDETPMIATYYPNDAEWSVEEFPEWDNPDVKYWMPVPDVPR